ncbi:MAG: hypothetical protein ABI182_08635 [Candidatus Baltobacteraceae bacterium]
MSQPPIVAYLLACSAGVYLAAAVLLIVGRWQPLQRVPVWLWLATLTLFAIDRLIESLNRIAAPLVFIGIAVVLLQSLHTLRRRTIDAFLWAILALTPFAVMFVVTIEPFFDARNATVFEPVVVYLLCLPVLATALAAMVRLRST